MTPGPRPVAFKAEPSTEVDSIGSFKCETELARAATASTRVQYARKHARKAGAVLLACGVVGAGSWLGWQTLSASRTTSATDVALGTAVFSSSPDGATILIDGVPRGTTPVKLSLAPGAHTVTITSGDVSRKLPFTIEAGGVVSQYVELAVQPNTTGGRLEVGSDPDGAEVRIDGTLRGITPLLIADLPVGPHKVTVSNDGSVINRTVNVTRGSTQTVVVSTGGAPAAAAAGWLTVDAPFELEVHEGQQLVGTTRSDRIMLPVGSHTLELTSRDLEFADQRTVRIAPGRTVDLTIALPNGKISVNAMPWAEVSIDGRAVGTTPLGNLTVPVGSHEVVWRHPQLGERRQRVTVKAQSPTRVGVNFNQ